MDHQGIPNKVLFLLSGYYKPRQHSELRAPPDLKLEAPDSLSKAFLTTSHNTCVHC